MSTIIEQQRAAVPSLLNASITTSTSPLRGVRLFRSISRRLASRRRSPTDSGLSTSSSSSSSSSGSSDSVFSLAPRLMASSWSSTSSLGGSASSASSASEGSAFKVKVKRVLTTLGAGFASRDAVGAKVSPKSILRAPVTTTFVRGMSGLPRRVPSRVCAGGCRGEVTLFSR